jgi:hypothetical protein
VNTVIISACSYHSVLIHNPHLVQNAASAVTEDYLSSFFNFILICIVGGGIKVHSTLRPLNDLLCQPRVIMIMEKSVNDWQGKPKYSEKTCPSAALSTTNPTCCPYANPGRRGGKPASNRWASARPSQFILCSLYQEDSQRIQQVAYETAAFIRLHL